MVAENIRLQINCPVLKENFSSFHEVLPWAKSLGIKANMDLMMMAKENFDQGNLKHRLNLSECENVIWKILKFDNNYKTTHILLLGRMILKMVVTVSRG